MLNNARKFAQKKKFMQAKKKFISNAKKKSLFLGIAFLGEDILAQVAEGAGGKGPCFCEDLPHEAGGAELYVGEHAVRAVGELGGGYRKFGY